MEFGGMIRGAWALTWRYRFLWVLGLFAGGAAGMPSFGNNVQWRADREDLRGLPPGAGQAAGDVAAWLMANLGLVIAIVALAVLIGLAFFVVSFIAQGGLAKATAEVATGHEMTLGRAWRAGLHFFWRYVGLWLVLAAAVLLIGAAVGALVVSGVLIANATDAVAPLVVLGGLLGLALLLAAIAGGVVASIVVAYAQRAIALEDLGPVAALRAGWQTFRGHLGDSLLTWVVSIGLTIGAAIAIALIVGVALAVLAAIGYAIWAATGLGAATIAYAALGLLALVAGGLVLAGIVNTFFWNYWTIAYLRLTGHGSEIVAA